MLPSLSHRIAPALFALVAAVAAACAPAPGPQPPGNGSVGDTAQPDALGELPLFGNGKDALSPTADATPVDASPETVAEPGLCVAPGTFGCACDSNLKCDSGACFPTANGMQCTKACAGDCPAGFKCQTSAAGGDTVSLCVARWPHLCNPCSSKAECQGAANPEAECLDHGPAGHFCGTPCATESDCPSGYGCLAAKTAAGAPTKQCQPLAATAGGPPGACTCSKSAINKGLSTACSAEVKDKDGKVNGVCKGVRLCAPDGLSACTAAAVEEVCNGLDDDCDGAVDEGLCDDSNACTQDACDGVAKNCGHVASPGSCDADGNLCTEGDACTDGVCKPGAKKSCDDGNPCTVDACDPATGCTQVVDDGAQCSDDNGCTVGDACKSGACKPGSAKACPPGDACNAAGCTPATGQCFVNAKADAAPCDDSNACTNGDLCTGGQCGGKAGTCDDGNGCTQDGCKPATGCFHLPTTTLCDDGDACTGGDVCGGGKCSGTLKNVLKVCDDGNACTQDNCDPKTGCVSKNVDGSPCDDGNPCTKDLCSGGLCQGNDNGACSCQKDVDCLKEDDGNACNGTLYCDNSVPGKYACKVKQGTIVTCSTSGDGPCTATSCDPPTGKCTGKPAVDGKGCDADGSVCTVGDACAAGACKPGKALGCDDGNACTDDACSPKDGCTHTANSSPCNADGSACTVGDSCAAKTCSAGPLKKCDDGQACTLDICTQATGACVFDAAQKQGQACDADGNLCTAPDTCKCVDGCKAGACSVGPTISCDDKNPCTVDTCKPATGCGYVAMADQTGCGANAWCLAGKCAAKGFCGDGKVNQTTEECDDGNTVAGDGCSPTCIKEGPKPPKPGELVISEIMADPALPDETGEWFEVYNPTGADLQLTGLTFKDNVGSVFVDKEGLVLKAGGWFVFGSSAEAAGGVSGFVYSSGTSKVQLANGGDTLTLTFNGQVIDTVAYGSAGTGWKSNKSGSAYSLAQGKADVTANDAGANWCYVTVAYGAAGEFGTPGKANPPCL